MASVLSSGDIAALRADGHNVRRYLSVAEPVTVATAQVNQSVFVKPLTQLTVDNTSAGWSNVKAGMTAYIGSAPGLRDRGMYRVGLLAVSVSNTLAVMELSSGDPGLLNRNTYSALQDNDYITIVDDYNIWSVFPSIEYSGDINDRNGVFFKGERITYGGENATIPPFMINLGRHRVAWSEDESDQVFSFSAATATFLGNPTAYLWDVGSGTITVGTSTSSMITASFPVGHHIISCRVTLDTGTNQTAYRHVWVHSPTNPPLSITVESDRRDTTSRKMVFSTTDDLADLLNGSMALYWERAEWGGDAISDATTQCVGWVREITDTTQANAVKASRFELVQALDIIKEQRAFSQQLTMAATPANWQEVTPALAYVDFVIFYLLYWHSTVTRLFDVSLRFLGNHRKAGWSVGESNLYDQVQGLARQVSSHIGQRSDGTLIMRKNPEVASATERSTLYATRMALTETDILPDFVVRATLRPRYGQARTNAFTYEGGVNTPVISYAMGRVGGQGGQTLQVEGLLVANQTELNELSARYLVDANNPIAPITLRLAGNYDVFEPADWHLAQVDVDGTYTKSGEDWTYLCAIQSVTVEHAANGVKRVSIEVKPLTSAESGTTGETIAITLPSDAQNAGFVAGNDYVFSLPSFDPLTGLLDFPFDPVTIPDITEPDTGEDVTAGRAIAWGDVLKTTAQARLTSPSWSTLLSMSGETIASVLGGETGMYALTDASLNYNSAPFASGSWVSKQSIGGVLLRYIASSTNKIGILRQAAADTPISFEEQARNANVTSNTYAQATTSPKGSWDGTWSSTVFITNYLGYAVYGGGIIIDLGLDAAAVESVGLEWQLTDNSSTDTQVQYGAHLYNDASDDFTGTGISANNELYGSGALPTSGSTSINIASAPHRYVWFGMEIWVKGSGNPSLKFKPLVNGKYVGEYLDVAAISYSADGGDSITTIKSGEAGLSDAHGYDADDYNLGIHMLASGGRVYYTTTYTGALTRLTGLAGDDENITFLRIPYKKLASQADNSDASLFQFLYGNDQGYTAGVTFNASTGAIVAESDMSITISATDYYVVGAEALETAGGNTQVIVAAVKPVGGGDTVVVLSTDGGGTWTIQQTLDVSFVRFETGSTQNVWLAGAGGIWRSTNRAANVTEQTGNVGITLGGGYGYL